MERFRHSLERAEAAGIPLANAMSLATADANGNPSVRMMLLKGADNRGFIFYTNLESRKGKELRTHSKVSISFWWAALGEQVRVEGSIKPVSDKEADTYFATRPRGSQIGAWASKQSERLGSREELIREARRLRKQYEGKEIPRPPFWSGFILVPERIEFWKSKPDRLHERTLYTRQGSGWSISSLYP